MCFGERDFRVVLFVKILAVDNVCEGVFRNGIVSVLVSTKILQSSSLSRDKTLPL